MIQKSNITPYRTSASIPRGRRAGPEVTRRPGAEFFGVGTVGAGRGVICWGDGGDSCSSGSEYSASNS